MNIFGGSITGNAYGGYSDYNTAHDNTITISGGSITGNAYSGYSHAGTTYNNIMNISDGSITGNAYSGYSDYDTAYNNTITISNGSISKDAYGGYSDSGAAYNNAINISGGSINGNAFGSYSHSDSAYNNTITISGGTITKDAYSGYSGSGTAYNNTMNISGGTITKDAYSGYSDSGTAYNNTMNISGGTINGNAYGSYSNSNAVYNNAMIISGGILNGNIYGGYSDSSSAYKNAISISGSTITGNIYGSYSITGSTYENIMTISGKASINGAIYNAYSAQSSADKNKLTISGGTITGNIYNGYSQAGNAYNNVVTISGGNGTSTIYSGYSETSSANNNTINILGGKNVSTVYGGFSGAAYANENIINVRGGTIDTIYGGYSSGPGFANNNTVNLWGGIVTGKIHGGYSPAGTGSNNVLNIYGNGLKAENIADFQKINFFIPTDAVNKDIILTLSDPTGTGIDLTGLNKLNGMYVLARIKGDNPSLQKGDTVTLLHDAGTGTISGNIVKYGELIEGCSLKYRLDILKSPDSKDIWATFPKDAVPTMNPDTKSLVETQALGAALINSSTDMMSESGIRAAKQAASQPGTTEASPFAVLGNANMRYHTGSYIDSNGWNIGLGLSHTSRNKNGGLTFGQSINYGQSSYDSYLDDGIHGSGKSHYTGLSLLARQDDTDGFYYEGSLSGGRLYSDYNSSDLETNYDSNAAYYALHVGVGKVQRLNQTIFLDYYGKYFYSHQNGSSATLSSGETYNFSSINSRRIRCGTRIENAYTSNASLYYGIAWEYEFGGEALASYKGYDTPSPSLKGGSALIELGWKVKPKQDSPFSADMSFTGWTGKKEGFSLGVMLDWQL